MLVDATNAKARAYVWSLAKAGYVDHGIKIFWLDGSEPEGFIDLAPGASPSKLPLWPDSKWAAGPMSQIGQMVRDTFRIRFCMQYV